MVRPLRILSFPALTRAVLRFPFRFAHETHRKEGRGDRQSDDGAAEQRNELPRREQGEKVDRRQVPDGKKHPQRGEHIQPPLRAASRPVRHAGIPPRDKRPAERGKKRPDVPSVHVLPSPPTAAVCASIP